LNLSDVAWQRSISDSIDELVAQFRSHLPSSLRVLDGEIELSRLDTRALLSNGFDNRYRSTSAIVSARVQASGGLPVRLRMQARQRKDLRWQEELEAAERRSLAAASATLPESGPCDLLLMASAYLPAARDDFGIWTPLARQSEARRAASGLARYQLGQEILARAPTGDSLTLMSDGTLDFGLRSAPFDEQGQAVRRFSLVDKGRAAGHSVDYRDAALSRVNANGGVRNLVVDAGATPFEQLQRADTRPLLVVHTLSDLYTEERGACTLRVGSAEWRHHDATGALVSKAVRGGVISGNIYDWLSRAHFTREVENLLWYQGPKAIRFDKLQVQA
jgi:predicted Zn-dependent protease